MAGPTGLRLLDCWKAAWTQVPTTASKGCVRPKQAHSRALSSLMTIAAELRILIYEQLFFNDEDISDCGAEEHRAFMFICPFSSPWLQRRDGFPRISTLAILRVSRQVYHEALPVMWSNIAVIVRDSYSYKTMYTPSASLSTPFDFNAKAITMIRHISITKSMSSAPTPYQRAASDHRFEALCEGLRCATNLKFLRVHLDLGHTASRRPDCIRQLTIDLRRLVKVFDRVKILVDCHFNHQPPTTEMWNQASDISRDVCKQLKQEAAHAGKRIYFGWYDVIDPTPKPRVEMAPRQTPILNLGLARIGSAAASVLNWLGNIKGR